MTSKKKTLLATYVQKRVRAQMGSFSGNVLAWYINVPPRGEKHPPFWGGIDQFCGCSGPKHMCVWLQTSDILFQSQYQFIRKVHEGWDGNHGQFSTPPSPFSTKPIPMLEENRQVLWMVQPKTHVCMVEDYIVLYHLNFNMCSLSRFVKPGRGIVDEFLLQPHHFLSKPSPYLRKNDQFCDCSGLKHTCMWLQTGVLLFQSQYDCIRKAREACGMGIMDTFLPQIHHILQSKSTFLRENDTFC